MKYTAIFAAIALVTIQAAHITQDYVDKIRPLAVNRLKSAIRELNDYGFMSYDYALERNMPASEVRQMCRGSLEAYPQLVEDVKKMMDVCHKVEDMADLVDERDRAANPADINGKITQMATDLKYFGVYLR